jgi:protein-S-isoprenylcysteine O-methyltransferase Ste14
VRHLRTIGLLPFTVTVVIPTLILLTTQSVNVGWSLTPPLNLLPIILGILFIVAGLFLLYQTIRLFATVGDGTLAPWEPTQKLVVVGVYRYVRNPMISGVLSILLGESLLFGSVPLVLYFAAVTILNLIYMPLSEEPGLLERFGEDYRLYQQNVPPWIPRRTPWTQPTSTP